MRHGGACVGPAWPAHVIRGLHSGTRLCALSVASTDPTKNASTSSSGACPFNETGHLIIAKLSRAGYEEVDRWKMLEPTGSAFGRSVVWSHPAFANRCVYGRNDKEIVCVSLDE